MNNLNTARRPCDGHRHGLTSGWRPRISPIGATRIILISLACATGAGPSAFAQAPLWFTPRTPDVVSASDSVPTVMPAKSRTYRTSLPVATLQVSPSDPVVEVANAPDLGLTVVNRLTDKDQARYEKSAHSSTPLLNTESMIGPLQGAERMFSRLDITDGLRGAPLARPGPRADAEDYLWSPASTTWVSPVLQHYPLYFEQPNLERYGIGSARIVQPLLSSVHFFGSIPLVPYKTLTHHPRERVYTLGQGRPGNCVPVQRGVILGTSSVGEMARFRHLGSGY